MSTAETGVVFRTRTKAGEPEEPLDPSGLSSGNCVQAESFHIGHVRNYQSNGGDSVHGSREIFAIPHIDGNTRCATHGQPAAATGYHVGARCGQGRNNVVSDETGGAEEKQRRRNRGIHDGQPADRRTGYPRLFETAIDSLKISVVDLIKLRYFRVVARTLHFRRAAELLGVSQPPLSKSIKILEEQLGTPLFVRTRRRVELTPAGEALLERSERIFQELEDARLEVKRHGSGEKGVLRLGCEDGTTFSVLPPVLQNFQKEYPSVQCSMVTQPLDTLIVALRSDDLDAAVLPLPVNDPELELTKLGSCSLIAAFAARLPLAAKPRLRLRDLNDQPIVALPDYPANLYSWILPYLKKRRIRFNPVRGAFDLTTLLLMAASGLGIALVPGSYRQCGPPGLVYREITDSTLDLSVALAWKKGTPNAVVSNFVRVVRGMRLG